MYNQLTNELLLNSFDSCYYYATHQVDKFVGSTDGPRHRDLVSWVMNYKHTNGIIREKIVARVLGLVHNPRMHSTHGGVTTFDATDASTGVHYEIKTEQYNCICDTRTRHSDQLKGSGMFSSIHNSQDLAQLLSKDPVIAHGVFIDGKLCGVATFKLASATSAVNRLLRYCQSSGRTVPRYYFSDWGHSEGTKFRLFSHQWPSNIAAKYRAIFEHAATSGQATII